MLWCAIEMTGSRHHSHHVSKVGGAEGLGQGANQKTSLAPSVVCTVIYIACSLLQGLCNLYKEYCIISWSPEPMDIHLISSWLLFYQWLFVILASPVLYYLQGTKVIHVHVYGDVNAPQLLLYFVYYECVCTCVQLYALV